MREYTVIFEKGPVSWGAYIPDLPGLAAAGASLEEVQGLIKEGLEFHLEGMLEDGDPIPEPHSHAGTIQTDLVETWSGQLAKSA